MIYTLTPNPAVDMNVSADVVVPNRVCRTKDAVYTPNGKGLNVSFTLQHFGVHAPILGFFGGFSGTYIVDEARKKGCDVYPVMVDGITRINPFISTPTQEYTFPNAGCSVPEDKQHELLQLLSSLDDLTCLVVSGSLPPEVKPTFYDEIFDTLAAKHVDIVLDTSSSHLSQLGAKKPLLIKPNDDELHAIFGYTLSGEDDTVRALHDLGAQGFQNVLLTLGSRGAYFYNGTHVWYANAPKIKPYSTVCAGDATLGCFLASYVVHKTSVEQALTVAMACGANVAMSAGLGTFSRMDELKENVHVKQID